MPIPTDVPLRSHRSHPVRLDVTNGRSRVEQRGDMYSIVTEDESDWLLFEITFKHAGTSLLSLCDAVGSRLVVRCSVHNILGSDVVQTLLWQVLGPYTVLRSRLEVAFLLFACRTRQSHTRVTACYIERGRTTTTLVTAPARALAPAPARIATIDANRIHEALL